MDKRHVALYLIAAGMLASVAACGERSRSNTGTSAGAAQTGFPGQVTAGGGTSGEVMARAKPATDGSYAGGTPGIAGGSGGNTGGAATGGSVQESGRGPSQGVNTPGGAQAGGTPGIPAGSGGNTGGAATGGSVQQGAGQAPPQGAAAPSTSSQASTSIGSASSTTSTTRP